MKKIESIIYEKGIINNEIIRFKYMPYSEMLSKQVFNGIIKSMVKEPRYEPQITKCWSNMIKYVHGDECDYDLIKSICLMGRTGSGKTLSMTAMREYAKIDNVKFIRNGKTVSFDYHIFSAREIVDEFVKNGYDGIAKYIIFSNICIDDLGSEPENAKYYGTELNVIQEIIERRYEKGLTTHYTTNLNEEGILKRYNDRVYSRMKQTCNFIKLNDMDFRL